MRRLGVFALVVGCGHHDAPPDRGPDAAPSPDGPGSVQTGALIGGTGAWPGFIAGVAYQSGGQTGVTDAQGTFRYEANAPVAFTVAGVALRPTAGAAIVSPYQLAAQGACSESAELER